MFISFNRGFASFALLAISVAIGSYGFTQSDVLIAHRPPPPEHGDNFVAPVFLLEHFSDLPQILAPRRPAFSFRLVRRETGRTDARMRGCSRSMSS